MMEAYKQAPVLLSLHNHVAESEKEESNLDFTAGYWNFKQDVKLRVYQLYTLGQRPATMSFFNFLVIYHSNNPLLPF